MIWMIHSLLAASLIFFALPGKTFADERWLVSVRHLPMEQGERIVGVQVKIRFGNIVSMPKIPPAWEFRVSNDNGPVSSLEGIAVVGAAALDPQFFKNFLVVSKDTGKYAGEFDLAATLSTTVGFETHQTRTLAKSDLLLTPLRSASDKRRIKP